MPQTLERITSKGNYLFELTVSDHSVHGGGTRTDKAHKGQKAEPERKGEGDKLLQRHSHSLDTKSSMHEPFERTLHIQVIVGQWATSRCRSTLGCPHTDGQTDPEQQTGRRTIKRHLLLLASQQHGTLSSVSETGSQVQGGLDGMAGTRQSKIRRCWK